MNRQAKKRMLRIRLTLVYSAMILAIAGIVTGLYFIIQGYRFNQYDGRIEQGGLVQFGSVPSGADVWLDQSHLGNKTPSKLTVSAGTHTVSMTRSGYDEWKKDVQVRAGAVLWLDYIRFVPQKLVASTPVTLSGAASSKVSRDTNTEAVIENPAQPVITLINLNTDTPDSHQVTLPAGTYTQPAQGESQQFTVMGWAYDNRYIMLKHTYGNSQEWITLDTTNPTVAKNITTTLGVDATDVKFTTSDANTMYVLSQDGNVRKANIDQKTLSGPLLTNVSEFSLYDNETLAYTTNPDPVTHQRSAGYLTQGAASPRVLYKTTANDTESFIARLNKYYGKNYFAIAHGQTVRIYTGDLVASDTKDPAPFTLVDAVPLKGPVQYLGFSPDQHRFVYAGSGSSVMTYDLDIDEATPFELQAVPSTGLDWIDDFHFATIEGQELRMYDYDGTNGHDMMQNVMPGDISLSQNDKYLTAITKTGDTVGITRDAMIIN